MATQKEGVFFSSTRKYFLNGDSKHDIAGKMIISRNLVHYIITKYKKKQNV